MTLHTAETMVRQNVLVCLSSMVATLAGGSGYSENKAKGIHDLMLLAEQAAELCAPVLDYEEAARQVGWRVNADGSEFEHVGDSATVDADPQDACGWEDLCREANLYPYEREIFEHWVVTEWLAEKLEAAGERVDRDFADLCVWGRTCTGQGIAQDGVIIRIHAAMMRPFT